MDAGGSSGKNTGQLWEGAALSAFSFCGKRFKI